MTETRTHATANPAQHFQSVRTRLSAVLGLAMLPIVAFTIASAIGDYARRDAEMRERLLTSIEVISSEVDHTFESAGQTLRIVREQLPAWGAQSPYCADFLRSALAGNQSFANVASIDPVGTVTCSAAELPGPLNVSDDEWFRKAIATGGFSIGGPLNSRLDNTSVLIASLPVDKMNGPESGLVVLSLRTDFLNSSLRFGNVSADTELFLIDADGRSLLKGADESLLPLDTELSPLLAGDRSVIQAEARNGSDHLYASLRLGESDTYALLARPALEANFPLFLELTLDVSLPVLLTAITLLIVWFATDRMSLRWVKHLRAVAIAHRRGMSGVRAREYETAPIEYRELGDALNSMADAIEARQKRLLETLHERESLLREIHHRVKNNLQIIISLFNLQARNAETEEETMHLRDMQARVESLALVHHAAYQSDDLQVIDMREFVPSLLSHIERVMDGETWSFAATCDVDSIALDMDKSVPLAQLIVEEISAIRMFSAEDADGNINVTFKRTPARDKAMLSISHDFPAAHTPPAAGRIQLSRSLVTAFARQLGGGVESDDGAGNVTITMPYSDAP